VLYYNLSAKQGHLQAQYNLGYCYENGFGVEVDLKSAIYYYELAAKQGDSLAQNILSSLK